MGETYRDPTMSEWSRPSICCTCGNLVGDRTVHDQHHADQQLDRMTRLVQRLDGQS